MVFKQPTLEPVILYMRPSNPENKTPKALLTRRKERWDKCE